MAFSLSLFTLNSDLGKLSSSKELIPINFFVRLFWIMNICSSVFELIFILIKFHFAISSTQSMEQTEKVLFTLSMHNLVLLIMTLI